MPLYIKEQDLREMNVLTGELNKDREANMKLLSYDFYEVLEETKEDINVQVSILLRTERSNKVFRFEHTVEPFTYSTSLERIDSYEGEKGIMLVLVNLSKFITDKVKCSNEVCIKTMPIDHGIIYSEAIGEVSLLNHIIVADDVAEEFTSELKGIWVDISEAKKYTNLSEFSTMVLDTVKEI